jgi:hypothetical protein
LPGPKVFVSYSHRDGKALEQLQRFLRPLEREGLLAAWADTRLQGGDDWAHEIDEALDVATVAVLLISQDFLASDFIVKQELPHILEREATGLLTVLPVFLGSSQVKTLGFPDPRPGGRGKVFLTRFQGYGTPDKPLADRTWSERDKIYLQLSERLRALAGLAPAVPTPGPAPVGTPSVQEPSGPARVYELTVQLENRKEDLLVTCHLPGLEPIASATVAWEEVRRRIDPIHEALDDDGNLKLLAHVGGSPGGWGQHLFDVLFGGPERWEPIFRAVFGRPAGLRPSPTFGPVRLRVLAEDSRLSGLPWRLTAWQGQPLVDHGWLFTTTRSVDPEDDLQTTAPSTVLVVAPRLAGNGGGPHDPEHVRAVLDVLEKVWPTGRDPGYVQVARTRAEIAQGLRGLRPHMVYFYGRGAAAGGRPGLLLEGPQGAEPLALAELLQLFTSAGHTPAVVYLNTEGLNEGSGANPSPTPDRILGTDVPLLLWRRRPEWSVDSSTAALQWLLRWLGQGEDPVTAFHQIHRATLASCEACAVAIHSNYRTWRTATYQGTGQRHYPLLRLDRDRPKAQMRKHLEELVRSSSRRVMALVSYAASGNALEFLWEQIRHDLEGSALARLVEIRWLSLQVPAGQPRLRHDLEEELKLQLEAEPNEPVTYLLRRRSPRAVGPHRRPVLWLNWTGLASNQMEAWLQFSSEFLASHCPTDLHIVSYAALEVPLAGHKRFSGKLQELRKQPWCRSPAFKLTELPPLEEVAESDLLDFLEEPDNSSCDPGIQQEVAERIIAQTGGAFAETIALLEEAESGSWYDLLARLRNEQETDR